MHVTEKGNQLIVQTRFRSLIAMLIFGLIFAAIGLGVFWLAGRYTTLECTRLEAREVRCEIKQTVLGLPVRRVEALNPREAIVEVSEDSDGDTYRVALVTARGTVPLTEFYSSDVPTAKLTQQINEFLSDTTVRSLSLSQQISPWLYLFPFCFTSFGMMMILSIRFESYTFDRDHEVLIIKHESLRGTRKREEPLHGLRALVRETKDSDGDPVYGVHVLLASGDDIALGSGSSRSASPQQLAERIQDFVKSGVRITYVDVKD